MKRLLRGVIDFEDKKINAENLRVNFQRLQGSTIEWVRPEDEKIFGFVKAFFQNNLALPSGRTILDYFTRSDDIEVQERVGDIQAAEVYTRTNYAHLLNQLWEDQNRVKMLALCKETMEIVSKGLIIQEGREKKRIQGVRDASIHFTSHVHDLIPSEHNAQTRGDVRCDTQAAWDEYQTAKLNKDKVWGKFTGIEEIDKICHGLKRGEMWVHAAFAGELKSMFAINWAYNLVTRYRTNVFYCSFEMPYEQLRRMIIVRHTANPRFEGRHEPLDYRKVRDGELTDEEEEFYKEVLKDWDENPEYCRFHIWCPDRDVNVDDIRIEAELLHKQIEVGFLVLDHGGLMEPRKRNNNYTIELNSVLRDSKKLALYFNHGEGLPVLMLFQINRDGKDQADKAEGKYKLRALSYANEAERSADTVSTTYLNEDHRENGTSMCCCLKNRDNPLFDAFLLGVNFSCRKIFRLSPDSLAGSDMGIDGQDDDLNALLELG
jgi:replicative DNA helicase